MPNTFFQFKQFIVHQDQCAMKVCTDACILGAWFAQKKENWTSILDIGSGTGLLMLMLAQKQKATISGVEIDLPAFAQLQENIGRSPWHASLNTYNGDVRSLSLPGNYDFIISNPPFFEGDLPSGSTLKNLAKHSKDLTLAELLHVIDTHLNPDGSFGILLPYHRLDFFGQMASRHGFSLREKLLVRQTPRHDFFRGVLWFSRNEPAPGFVENTELTIKNEENEDSAAFQSLLRDYYLKL